MKKLIAVIGFSYRTFNEWAQCNVPKAGHEYVFVDREEKARARIFTKIEFMHDCHLLRHYSFIKELCEQRLKV